MLITPRKQSRPTTKRTPQRKVRLTERDQGLIGYYAEHRFLRTSDVKQLGGFPSDRSCQQRVKELRDAGLIQLIEPKYGDPHAPEGGGNPSSIHALSNAGAKLCAQRYGIWMSSRYNENNRKTAQKIPTYIDHELSLADFMVRLEVQCRTRGDVELIPFMEILRDAPKETRESKKQREWPIVVEWNGKVRPKKIVTPDKIFGLRDLTRPEGKNRVFFFLEIDRSSETVNPVRKTFPDTSIFHKMLEYAFTYRDEIHKTRYNLPGFRVLFVTGGLQVVNPEERVQNFIETFEKEIRAVDISHPDKPEMPKRTPGRLFLFIDDNKLDAHAEDYLSAPWINARREPLTLLG